MRQGQPLVLEPGKRPIAFSSRLLPSEVASYLSQMHYFDVFAAGVIVKAPDALEGVKSYALDPRNAERLWEMSEQLVGQRFTFGA